MQIVNKTQFHSGQAGDVLKVYLFLGYPFKAISKHRSEAMPWQSQFRQATQAQRIYPHHINQPVAHTQQFNVAYRTTVTNHTCSYNYSLTVAPYHASSSFLRHKMFLQLLLPTSTQPPPIQGLLHGNRWRFRIYLLPTNGCQLRICIKTQVEKQSEHQPYDAILQCIMYRNKLLNLL